MTQDMLESGPSTAPVLSVFDFDGTLTRRDSFVPFLMFAFGKRAFVLGMLRMLPALLRYVRKGMNRDQLKAALIASFLKGARVEWVEHKAAQFQQLHWRRLMRSAGVRSVASEVAAGARVTLCSASPRLVLQPFANELGIELIATELEECNGTLTGRISGSNCRCEAKVLRLEAVYGPLGNYRLKAWGDTRGDHELLAAAHEPHWRHFHPRWQRGRLNVDRIGQQVRTGESHKNSVTGATADGQPPNDQQGT
jgi:phosphatidylglycerophosphatase C